MKAVFTYCLVRHCQIVFQSDCKHKGKIFVREGVWNRDRIGLKGNTYTFLFCGTDYKHMNYRFFGKMKELKYYLIPSNFLSFSPLSLLFLLIFPLHLLAMYLQFLCSSSDVGTYVVFFKISFLIHDVSGYIIVNLWCMKFFSFFFSQWCCWLLSCFWFSWPVII